MIVGMGQFMHKDFAAVMDAATTAGDALPSYEQRVKMTAYVRRSDSRDGVWALRDVFYNFYQDSGAEGFGLYNWKNAATFKLTKTGTITYASNAGITPNGSTGYYDTGWIPETHGVNYTLTDAGLTVKISAAGTISSTGIEVGCSRASANNATYIQGRSGTTVNYRFNGNTTRTATKTTPVGYMHSERRNTPDARTHLFYDSAEIHAAALAVATKPNVSMTVGCLNNNGTKSSFSDRQIQMVAASASLTGKEVDDYNTYQNFIT